MGVSTGRGGQMEGREGERTGERLKRGKDGERREKMRAKRGERRASGACFGAVWCVWELRRGAAA